MKKMIFNYHIFIFINIINQEAKRALDENNYLLVAFKSTSKEAPIVNSILL